MSELREIVQKVRNQRAENLGVEDDEKASDILMGRCRKNSKKLKKELVSQGYDARICAGVLSTGVYNKDEIESFSDAISRKEPIHFWVEVERKYICEVASESDLYYGEPVAEPAHPEQLGYIIFDDSYTWANQNL